MNANELADKLDDIPVNDFESLDQHHYTRQAATMLRQQQAKIEALSKPLSDEEISQVYKEVSEPFGEKRLYEIHDFARAIEERHGIK